MPLQQLNVRLPAELITALRQEAASSGRTLAAVVEQRLSGHVATASAPGPELADPLADRLAAIENRLAALESKPRPQRPAQQPLQAPVAPAPLDSRPPGAAVTTNELAQRTGTNRAAWNNWAAKAAIGAVRDHPQAGSWRLVGKGPGPNGGPDRWLWEPAR